MPSTSSTSVLPTATPVNLRFSTSQATPAPSGDRHSTVHIGSIRIHGTQLLLVSSNRFDFGRRSPERHSAFRFQPATACGENKSSAWICFPALKPVLVLLLQRLRRPDHRLRSAASAAYNGHSLPMNSRWRRGIPSAPKRRARTIANTLTPYCSLLSLTKRPGKTSRVVNTAAPFRLMFSVTVFSLGEDPFSSVYNSTSTSMGIL